MVRARLASTLAAVAAVGFALEGAIIVRQPQGDSNWHPSGYVVEAAFAVALAAAVPVLPHLAAAGSRLARWAGRGAQAGFTAMFVSAVPSLAVGRNELGPVFLLGVALSLLSLLVLSATALRGRVTGWWVAAIALIGLLAGIALGDQGGGIALGVAWAAIAVALRDEARAPAPVTA